VVDKDELARLLEYNVWANHRVLRGAALVKTDDFVRDLKATYKSLRGTLTHIMATEWSWLERWQSSRDHAVYTLPTGEAYEVPLWKLVQNMVNYSTQYRGQAELLLRQVGGKPAPSDLLIWDLNRDGPWGGSAALGPSR
jgi:uncharacterized damage-inducible protein DinB